MMVVAKIEVSYQSPKNSLLTKKREILHVLTDPLNVDRVMNEFRKGWELFLSEEKEDMKGEMK